MPSGICPIDLEVGIQVVFLVLVAKSVLLSDIAAVIVHVVGAIAVTVAVQDAGVVTAGLVEVMHELKFDNLSDLQNRSRLKRHTAVAYVATNRVVARRMAIDSHDSDRGANRNSFLLSSVGRDSRINFR